MGRPSAEVRKKRQRSGKPRGSHTESRLLRNKERAPGEEPRGGRDGAVDVDGRKAGRLLISRFLEMENFRLMM